MLSRLIALIFLLAIAIMPDVSAARIEAPGGIEINSVRIDLSNTQPITNLTVTNHKNQTVLFQITAKQWLQNGNQNLYKNTDHLIITPQIFKIKAHQAQIIRLGLLQPNATEVEQTYRIFITQLPDINSPEKNNISVLFEFSVPVFLAAPNKTSPRLTVNKVNNQLTLKNNGNTHIQIRNLAIVNPKTQQTLFDQNELIYILAKGTYQFRNVPKALLLKTPLLLKLKTDESDINLTINS